MKKMFNLAVLAVLVMLVSSCTDASKSGEEKGTSTSTSELRSNVLDAARLVLNDRLFRRALILQRGKPSYPSQLKERFSLSSLELAAVGTFAMRVHQDENAKLLEKYPFVAGFNTNPSRDFWGAFMDGTDADKQRQLVNSIEQALGVSFRNVK
jgi:hypothetical protein